MERADLIDLIYEGAADERAMQNAIRELLGLTRSRGAQFGTLHRSGRWVRSIVVDYDTSDMVTYLEHFMPEDPRLIVVARNPGRILTGDDVILDPVAFEQSALVNEFLDPKNARFGMALTLPINDSYSLDLSLMRSRSDGDYRSVDVETMEFFLPSLKRSLDLRIKLGIFESKARALSDVVDAVDSATFLVTSTGSLVRGNARGQAMLSDGTFVFVRNGRLEPRNLRFVPDFSAMIERSAQRRPEDAVSEADTTLTLEGPGGKKAVATVLSLHSSVGRLPGAEVALFLKELAPAHPQVAGLGVAFGLTGAETRLAQGLLAGKNLETLASQWTLSRETLRTQLSSLYRKTGTHSQSELITALQSFLSFTVL